MIDLSSLTSIIASLLSVALLSTSYAHLSFYLPIFVSSFLFLNFLFACNKMRPENKVITPQGLQIINGDEKVLDQSQIADSTASTVFGLDLMCSDHVNRESDERVEFGPNCSTLGPNLCLNSAKEAMIEDMEEEHLIEIQVLKQAEVELKEEGLEDLIEIDISMGSIRYSGSGSGWETAA